MLAPFSSRNSQASSDPCRPTTETRSHSRGGAGRSAVASYSDGGGDQRRPAPLAAEASVDLRALGQRCCHGNQVPRQRGPIQTESLIWVPT